MRPWRGLSAKFLVLTILFVMMTEVLILVPSVANFRWSWITDRLDQARAASGVFDSALRGDPMLQKGLLMALDAEVVVLRSGDMSEMIRRPGPLPPTDVTIYEDEFGPWMTIKGAFDQIVNGGDRLLRVVSRPGENNRRLEIFVHDTMLQEGMFRYMRNIILISLLIALVTSLLVFASVRALLIRPIQRMSEAMLGFAEKPDDESRVIVPSGRNDELGFAEVELADMQRQLSRTLAQQRRLAELGLAVSKINHDMRNILASAQLVTDRLTDVDDPLVQRVAPRLVRALDRAVGYSEGVLEYGRAGEANPNATLTELAPLLEDVRDVVLAERDDEVQLVGDFPPGYRVCADREQLLRVLLNLSRNAVQAMDEGDVPSKRLTIAGRDEGKWSVLTISDTGPGLPPMVAKTLFTPFTRSGKKGGTGLGLSIARELIEAHGGEIDVDPRGGTGTTFRIRLPRP